MTSSPELRPAPRIIVAGASGDAGKTTVALGLIRAFRSRKMEVQPFKKGPDFIDPAWLSRAAGCPARNLDQRLCGDQAVLSAFDQYAPVDGISVIEGNRGLFDGGDADGTHSTAALARLLGAPVVLVVNVTKVTRTAAAFVYGCMHMEPDTPVVGVVLNRVAGKRHQRVTSEAIERATGVPVVGALPRLPQDTISSRHLGLLTPQEHESADAALDAIARLVGDSVDVDAIISLARSASPRPLLRPKPARSEPTSVTIGVLQDAAFTFYYPENLEALEALGARLLFVSPLRDERLPKVDALYIGGGFPETHAAALANNRALMGEIRKQVSAGLPVYAECGGLMYMSRRLEMGDRSYEMVGALPLDMAMQQRPVGHGYVRARVTGATPFYSRDEMIVGHEFHYSKIVSGLENVTNVFRMERGSGVDGDGAEGLCVGNVLGTYVHVHALGTTAWARGMVSAAHAARKTVKQPAEHDV